MVVVVVMVVASGIIQMTLVLVLPFRHTILLSGELTHGPLFILLPFGRLITEHGVNCLNRWPMIYPVRNAELIMPIG